MIPHSDPVVNLLLPSRQDAFRFFSPTRAAIAALAAIAPANRSHPLLQPVQLLLQACFLHFDFGEWRQDANGTGTSLGYLCLHPDPAVLDKDPQCIGD